MELGNRGNADRGLDVRWRFFPDKDGGIKDGAHPLLEWVNDGSGKSLKVCIQRSGSWGAPNSAQRRPADPSPLDGWTKLCHWPACDGDRDLLARFGPAQHLAHVIPKFLLGNGRHKPMVAELLPVPHRAVFALGSGANTSCGFSLSVAQAVNNLHQQTGHLTGRFELGDVHRAATGRKCTGGSPTATIYIW